MNSIMSNHFYYGGGFFGSFIDQLAQAGVFSYVLPFLLLFALVYGILLKTKLFEDNKSINSIIALAIALMALQFDFVPLFFSQIFPLLGVGLAVLLVAMIMLGIFLPKERWAVTTMFTIAAVILIFILINTSQVLDSAIGFWISNNWQLIIGIVLVLIVIGAIVNSNKEPKDIEGKLPAWMKGMFEGSK